MLTKATLSLAKAKMLGGLAPCSVALAATSPLLANIAHEVTPCRPYSFGKWSKELRAKTTERSSRRKEHLKKHARKLFRRREREAVALEEARPEEYKRRSFVAALSLATTKGAVTRSFNSIKTSFKSGKAPLLVRETTQVLQGLRYHPQFLREVFTVFQTALDNPKQHIERSSFTAVQDAAERGFKFHAWRQLNIATQRLFPSLAMDWLGELNVVPMEGKFTLPSMTELLAHEEKPSDVIAMASEKRAMKREVLPTTRIRLIFAYLLENRVQEANKELFDFWKFAGLGDGVAPKPFDPVFVCLIPRWQFVRDRLPVDLTQMLSIASALEKAGQYSAALSHLGYVRYYLRAINHNPIREVTAAGVKRDFMDLSHLKTEHIIDTLRLNLTEMRIRRAMVKAIEESKPANVVTQINPAAYRAETPFITAQVEDLVVLTDRSFRLAKDPCENGPQVREFLRSGGVLFGTRGVESDSVCFSKWSSSSHPSVAENAALEQAARKQKKGYQAVQEEFHKLMRPERSIVIKKEWLTKALDESSASIGKSKRPF